MRDKILPPYCARNEVAWGLCLDPSLGISLESGQTKGFIILTKSPDDPDMQGELMKIQVTESGVYIQKPKRISYTRPPSSTTAKSVCAN